MKLTKANIKRVQVSPDFQQITTKDSRFYKTGDLYYPSITYVLGTYPKGKFFEDWLKKVGYASEHIVKKAAGDGTMVHELAERYLLGEEIKLLRADGNPIYDLFVWKMFLRFVDFWETQKPELLETEVFLHSNKYRVAGTCDLVCRINDEVWVIDLKTSNHLQTTYDLQTALYRECFEECYDTKVDRVGVLWLKSKSRGEDKDGKRIKGKNWEVVESKRSQEENLEIFSHVRAIFDLENPNPKPLDDQFPTSVKR